ncbi:MAG TPA: peptide deformylase [Candidatus Deferrimicrobium sp.]|nr:peptide deformylase [Candidatus Deferrimicrobium sp.]
MEEKKILDIYKYGDDVLKLKASEIKNIDEQIVRLRDLMVATMHNTRSGIGLAAPQVGESLQLSVIDISMGQDEKELVVLINPEILEVEGKDMEDEGCLSFPGISAPVNRSTRIFLKNFDMNGKEVRQEIEGYLARVIQHEIDHLNGVLIIDRVSSLRRQILKKEIKRLQRNEEW